jgi:hypothetical protein
MAAGTLMIPWVTRFVDPVMATGWHMFVGGLPLLGWALVSEPGELTSRLSDITPGAFPSSAIELNSHFSIGG